MKNKELFQETFSKIILGEEKRKELIAMSDTHKPKRKFRMTKAAAAAIALCLLVFAGGSITYAVTDGKVFNNVGNWLKATITINGESQESQITQKPNGDFIIKYGTKDSGGEIICDGSKNNTFMVFEINFNNGKSKNGENNVSISKDLEIHESYSRENQLWEIRQQMLPFHPNKGDSELSSNYITALTQAVEKLEGIWKEGVLLAIQDIKAIKAGRKITIEDYDFEKCAPDGKPEGSGDGISWLYIDYTDRDRNAKFTQMSDGGYRTEFEIRFENGELREYGPVK